MNSRSFSRRKLLAGTLVGSVVSSAGCLEFGTTGSEPPESELRLVVSRSTDPLRDQYVVDLSETRSTRDEEAFETTLDGGTYTTAFVSPFQSTSENPTYALRDGTYYRLGSVVVDEATATYPLLRLYELEGTDQGRGEPFDTLPGADRRAVQLAHLVARARGNDGGVPWGAVRRGGYVYWREAAREASTLVGDDAPERIRYRETTYEVEISREQFHDPVYRATVIPVAESPEAMERILRASFVGARLTRADLSADARQILQEATGNSYSESHPYSEGYRELLRAFDERAYLDGNIEKDAGVRDLNPPLVQYDGQYYDYHLRIERFE